MPAADPTRLVVAPSLLDETGRELTASTEATAARLAAHAAGPRAAPPLGDPFCTATYATAQHQFAGLVTLAVGQARALAHGLTEAAVLYAALDALSPSDLTAGTVIGVTPAGLGLVPPARAAA
jgi:hypothetical protein